MPWDDAGPFLRFSVTYVAEDEAAEDALMAEKLAVHNQTAADLDAQGQRWAASRDRLANAEVQSGSVQ